MTVGCVVPCFKGGSRTVDLVRDLVTIVDMIVIVDDNCPQNTGDLIKNKCKSTKVTILKNIRNEGVGFSAKKGFVFLMDQGCDIVVKIDADGQIKPDLIPHLIRPLLLGKSEAAKGNRFTSLDNIIKMPKIRIIGNLGLSFLNKLSTGYWELFDPTNGFVAFKSSALGRIRLKKVDNRYFFESDLLFQCALAQITFSQLSMRSVYEGEISSLNPIKEVTNFAGKHLMNLTKRLIYQYFILDFNAGSLELAGVLLGLILTTIFSMKLVLSGFLYGKYATPGESSLFAVLSIFTIQMFVAFIYYDATQQPLLRQLRR